MVGTNVSINVPMHVRERMTATKGVNWSAVATAAIEEAIVDEAEKRLAAIKRELAAIKAATVLSADKREAAMSKARESVRSLQREILQGASPEDQGSRDFTNAATHGLVHVYEQYASGNNSELAGGACVAALARAVLKLRGGALTDSMVLDQLVSVLGGGEARS